MNKRDKDNDLLKLSKVYLDFACDLMSEDKRPLGSSSVSTDVAKIIGYELEDEEESEKEYKYLCGLFDAMPDYLRKKIK